MRRLFWLLVLLAPLVLGGALDVDYASCETRSASAGQTFTCPYGKVAIGVADNFPPSPSVDSFRCCPASTDGALTGGTSVVWDACRVKATSVNTCTGQDFFLGALFSSEGGFSGANCCALRTAETRPVVVRRNTYSYVPFDVNPKNCPDGKSMSGVSQGATGAVTGLDCRSAFTSGYAVWTGNPSPKPGAGGTNAIVACGDNQVMCGFSENQADVLCCDVTSGVDLTGDTVKRSYSNTAPACQTNEYAVGISKSGSLGVLCKNTNNPWSSSRKVLTVNLYARCDQDEAACGYDYNGGLFCCRSYIPTPAPSPSPSPGPFPSPSPSISPSPAPSPLPSASPSPSASPTPDQRASNGLKIRCPVGVVAEENTTVSAFYTPDGVPACVGAAMTVTAYANQTYQAVSYRSCDPATGLHRFTINTTQGGSYDVTARYGSFQSRCAFDVVGHAPTPTPELSGWLVLAAALAAFGLARKGRTKP
ncbi:hypothetical protein HYV43_05500 [Candidatus Micrarchaeota archaeon]|nr:hypothetical protein [Candidatus Micrarchaeota archaeon]